MCKSRCSVFLPAQEERFSRPAPTDGSWTMIAGGGARAAWPRLGELAIRESDPDAPRVSAGDDAGHRSRRRYRAGQWQRSRVRGTRAGVCGFTVVVARWPRGTHIQNMVADRDGGTSCLRAGCRIQDATSS